MVAFRHDGVDQPGVNPHGVLRAYEFLAGKAK
jgi:hypothetical protein